MTAAKSPPRRARRLLGRLVLLLMLAGIAAGVYGWHDYRRFSTTALRVPADPVVFEVERGDSLRHIVAKLRGTGIDAGHDLYWRALAVEMNAMNRLQVGEYAVTAAMTPRDLLQKLQTGDVVQHRFTIVEGWSFRELRAAIAKQDALDHTIADLDDAAVMQKLDAAGVHPEGRFLPETYLYTRHTTDVELLRRARVALDAALDDAWKRRPADTQLKSADELLVLASIVEKETGLASERPQIAGVFLRRLALGMKLQTDPTVIYGLGAEYAGNITRAHLETDTPWNTYTRAGLPPTPIAMPGKAALDAVVSPADGTSLYFVARGDGSHEFSPTLDAHNRAVRKYQLQRE